MVFDTDGIPHRAWNGLRTITGESVKINDLRLNNTVNDDDEDNQELVLFPILVFENRNLECKHLTFSPDGQYFAWVNNRNVISLIPWSKTHNSFLYLCPKHLSESQDQYQKQDIVTFSCGGIIQSVAFGYGNAHLVPKKDYWTRFDFSNEIILATGHTNGRIRIWKMTGQLLLELMDHNNPVNDLAFSPDGTLRLVSASSDLTLKVWDLNDDGNMYKTFSEHRKIMLCVVWSPNAKLIASSGLSKLVFLWNMDTYKLCDTLLGHENNVVSCAFSPDGALLATASWDTKAALWDPYTGEMLHALCHVYPPPRPIFAAGANYRWVRGVAFNRDGNLLATVADDGLIRFWNLLGDIDPEAISSVEKKDLSSCIFSPSGQSLLVRRSNSRVTAYEAPTTIPSLLHLSRREIRKHTSTTQVDNLEIPIILQTYLKYKTFH